MKDTYVYCVTLPNGDIYREYEHTKFYERRGDAERCVKRNPHKDLKVEKFRLEWVAEE